MQQNQADVWVKPLEGTVTRTERRYIKDEELSTPENKRYKAIEIEVTEPAGFLLMFPKGHSIRVDEATAQRIQSRLVDPAGFVESEAVDSAQMGAVLKSAGGHPLVSVNVVAAKGGK